jgi:hypothetical protein
MYVPDNKGVYPLCHGIIPGQRVTMFIAKEGVPVEDAYGRRGILVTPLAVALPEADGMTSVVWRVAWEGGATVECELGDGAASVGDELKVINAVYYMQQCGIYHPGS